MQQVQRLTATQVADRTTLPLGTVRYYIHNGTLPSYKLGRRRFVDSDVLDAWIDNQKATTSRGGAA